MTNSLSYHNSLRSAQYDKMSESKGDKDSPSKDGEPDEEKTGNFIPIDKLMGGLKAQAMERAKLSQRGKPDGQ